MTDALGCPLPANRVRNALHRTLRDLGMPRVRVHDLRHSHASALLLAAGENPRLVTERLGHARVGFTLDTYGTCSRVSSAPRWSGSTSASPRD